MLHAIVIGIDEYVDPNIQDLSFACADAKAVAKAIETGLHPQDRRVQLMLDSKATLKGIRGAIGDALPRLATRKEDIVILYFAGHGSPETVGGVDEVSRYLIAHDTEYDAVYSTAIDMEREVTRWFQRLSAPELIVFFVDACFSGRVGGRTFEGPSLKRVRSRYRSGPVRLQDLTLGKGRAILTACDDDELAEEPSSLGHGAFTHALLEALSYSRNAQDGTIGLGSLYEQVRQQVVASTNGRQQPVLNGRVAGARLPQFRHS